MQVNKNFHSYRPNTNVLSICDREKGLFGPKMGMFQYHWNLGGTEMHCIYTVPVWGLFGPKMGFIRSQLDGPIIAIFCNAAGTRCNDVGTRCDDADVTLYI